VTRLETNREILRRLGELAEANPDWRFHQLLQNSGAAEPGEEQFYDESEDTLCAMDAVARARKKGVS